MSHSRIGVVRSNRPVTDGGRDSLESIFEANLGFPSRRVRDLRWIGTGAPSVDGVGDGILEVFGFDGRLEPVIDHPDDGVEAVALAGTGVGDARGCSFCDEPDPADGVLDVRNIPRLGAVAVEVRSPTIGDVVGKLGDDVGGETPTVIGFN